MAKIVFRHANGGDQEVEATLGSSVMEAAVWNGVDGIVAECGGSAMCATCHVYVESVWGSRLPPKEAVEEAMLDSAVCERKQNSRLSCQIRMTPELDGLIVLLPERQV